MTQSVAIHTPYVLLTHQVRTDGLILSGLCYPTKNFDRFHKSRSTPSDLRASHYLITGSSLRASSPSRPDLMPTRRYHSRMSIHPSFGALRPHCRLLRAGFAEPTRCQPFQDTKVDTNIHFTMQPYI